MQAIAAFDDTYLTGCKYFRLEIIKKHAADFVTGIADEPEGPGTYDIEIAEESIPDDVIGRTAETDSLAAGIKVTV